MTYTFFLNSGSQSVSWNQAANVYKQLRQLNHNSLSPQAGQYPDFEAGYFVSEFQVVMGQSKMLFDLR